MIRQKIRIGDILEEKGFITNDQLMSALKEQKESNFSKKLGQIFIENGYITEKEFTELLADQLHLDFIDLYGVDVDYQLMSSFSTNMLRNADAVVFKEDEEYIHVTVSDPLNYEAIELLERSIATKPIKLYVSLHNDILYVFDRLEIISTTKNIVANIKREMSSGMYKTDSDQSSIMQLIEQIVKSAIKAKASDIHIEPSGFNVSVRSRVDGVLRENFVFDLDVYNALASRIKILGNLDISEKRKSQDGRFSMEVDGNKYDFRLSTAPTMHGESIVMRILDSNKILLKLKDLGMEEKNLKLFRNYDFADALRSILRQDPDIIMVGEVRDAETLNISVQASLTGHLVFTTLHTNDAPSAITRMIQMDLEPYLIADSLIGVVAQRLVRKICPSCKKEITPPLGMIEKVKEYLPEEYQFYKGDGCIKCAFTGYNGRTMISEILRISETVSHMISINMNKYEIARKAEEEDDFEPMIVDGLIKALRGDTTLEEVLRVAK